MEDRVAKMEHTLQSVSDGNTTFQLRREDGSIEDVTLMPLHKFIFPEKISRQQLEAQVREILVGKIEPTGPLEYKIVPKRFKERADAGHTDLLLSDSYT